MLKSSNIHIMSNALLKASKVLRRDFNELEMLQNSKSGTDNFVSSSLRTIKELINADLVKIAVNLSECYCLKFTHINSHTNNTDEHSKGNNRADTLAVRGAVKDYIQSTTDIGNYKLTFGKHKTQCINKVPTSYLSWIASSSNFEELCNKKEDYRLEKEIVLHYLSKL